MHQGGAEYHAGQLLMALTTRAAQSRAILRDVQNRQRSDDSTKRTVASSTKNERTTEVIRPSAAGRVDSNTKSSIRFLTSSSLANSTAVRPRMSLIFESTVFARHHKRCETVALVVYVISKVEWLLIWLSIGRESQCGFDHPTILLVVVFVIALHSGNEQSHSLVVSILQNELDREILIQTQEVL
ncbi:hypothetical protein KCU85_g47, partial [Aureobasidium melanogenum]